MTEVIRGRISNNVFFYYYCDYDIFIISLLSVLFLIDITVQNSVTVPHCNLHSNNDNKV